MNPFYASIKELQALHGYQRSLQWMPFFKYIDAYFTQKIMTTVGKCEEKLFLCTVVKLNG
jgi:hypothetical protein